MNENTKLPNIEQELNRLWKAHFNANKIKACLFNLVVYTNEPRRTSYFKDLIRLMIEKFPCRIIFIQGDSQAKEPHLHVHIYTEGLSQHEGMLCDQITIDVTEPYLQRVPFLIFPHLIPDLPVYLLWGQDPIQENVILPHLMKFATRLIFDSECTKNLHLFSQAMLKRLDTSHIPLMDLNWARIGGWRDILAQTFDTEERIKQLNLCHTIKIIYNNRSDPFFLHADTQALYLQAWLAARLGWQYQRTERKSSKIILYYRVEDHILQVILQPQTREDLPSEEIIAIEVSGDSDYLCNLNRRTNTLVVVNCSTQYECQIPFNLILRNIRSGRSLMQEVFFQKPSNQYRQMLDIISHIEEN